jgi:NADPH-dependent F420 reductase
LLLIGILLLPGNPAERSILQYTHVCCDTWLRRWFFLSAGSCLKPVWDKLTCVQQVVDSTIAKALKLVNDDTTLEVMNMSSNTTPSIGIVGGTGDLGRGLALRLAKAGHAVLVGSRKPEQAVEAAEALTAELASRGVAHQPIEGLDNVSAAQRGDIVFVTVPFGAHTPTLESIKDAVQGKVLVDVTVPLVPPRVARVQLPPEGSAGMIAQTLLGEAVQVVSALQNVAAAHLQADMDIPCDVLVTGNEKTARQTVIDLIEAMGMRGFHAGLIHNAAAAEALTSVLININKQYKTHAGLRLTGIE